VVETDIYEQSVRVPVICHGRASFPAMSGRPQIVQSGRHWCATLVLKRQTDIRAVEAASGCPKLTAFGFLKALPSMVNPAMNK